jgi:thermitase
MPLEIQITSSDVLAAVRTLRSSPLVAYAEPDYRMHASAAPDDPDFNLQWGDQNTGQEIPIQEAGEILGELAPGNAGADDGVAKAWSVTTGSREIVVGEVDTGVDYAHPDLAENIWTNPGGIGGCEAGTHGYNALEQGSEKRCNPNDEDTTYGGHGTHVAGIIGAVGDNGIGVTGMNWQTTILPVKWLDSASSGNTSALIEALQWLLKAKEEGVNLRVVNDSATFEGPEYSGILQAEIEALGQQGVLFVNAAGNSANDDDNEPYERYPCDYRLANELCVTAINNEDTLPAWANYGPKTVNLAAPGVSILSTLRENKYGYLSGGSMASAQVSGAAALILSAEPNLSSAALKADILENVEELPSLAGKVESGGSLDVCKAMPGCAMEAPRIATGEASGVAQTSATLNATVNPNGGAIGECNFEYGTTPSYGSSVPCESLPGPGKTAVEVSAPLDDLKADTSYYFRIVAANAQGQSYGDTHTLTTEDAASQQREEVITGPPPASPTEVPPTQSVLPALEVRAPSTSGVLLDRTSLGQGPSNTVTVEIDCPAADSSCTGDLFLRTVGLVAAAKSHGAEKTAVLTLAEGSFRLLGGRTIVLILHLSPSARAVLARSHLLRATATILAHNLNGSLPTTKVLVTIRAAKTAGLRTDSATQK